MAIRSPAALLATGVGTCLAWQASAQDAAGTATPLAPITVEMPGAGDPNIGAADRAGSIYVTPDDLQRRDPQTLRQVFQGDAAVTVGGAQAASQKVYVNGIEETNLAVTVDGARQSRQVFHHATTNLLDPALFKSVRVDPGVAAADAGPGALAGAIAYETVDPGDLLQPGQDLGGYGTLRYQSNGNTWVGGLAGYGRVDGFEVLGYVRRGTGDDYENGDGDTVEGTGTDFTSALAKAAWESVTGHRLEFSYQQIDDTADRPFRANIGSIIGRPDPVVREYDLMNRNLVLGYEMTRLDGIWQPRAEIAWTESETNVPVPYGSEGSASGWSGKVENRFDLGTMGAVTAGLDFYDERTDYTDPATDEIAEQARNVGLYAQARLTPVDRLNLSFGLRADHQIFEGIDGSEFDNAGLSGNASAEFFVTDTLSLNAGYSSVFGGIALGEPYIYNPDWTYEDLEPVRAENANIGVDVAFGGLDFGLGYFWTEFENARDFNYSRGPWLPFDFRSEGWRADAAYSWGPGFVRLSYIDADVTSDGDPVDSDSLTYFGVPLGRVLALEAAHSFDDAGILVGGALETTFDNDDLHELGYQTIEGYTVVNLYAEYRPPQAQNLSVRLDVLNLFGETFSDRATYGQEFATVEPLYEPGRSIALSARISF